jgi:PDZ domain-containing secreted protein
MMDLKEMNKFLGEAALNTYVGGGARVDPEKAEAGMQELEYGDKNGKWYYIGVNVSKLTNAENTGFCVPIYRFLISIKNILEYNIIINKPSWDLEYQSIKQEEIKKNIFINYPKLLDKNIGVIITMINKNIYLNKYININDIILSINDNIVDYNGYIKFDFYPDKISLNEINIWFMINEILNIKVIKYSDKKIHNINIKLEYYNKNLFDYYLLDNYPKYYIENNNLVLSILTRDHINNIFELNLSFNQILKISSRFLYKQDLFTVYLSDINPLIFKKYNKYPVGDIIIEINDKTFNNYNEFMNIMKEKINKIKTIDNKIYYV